MRYHLRRSCVCVCVDRRTKSCSGSRKRNTSAAAPTHAVLMSLTCPPGGSSGNPAGKSPDALTVLFELLYQPRATLSSTPKHSLQSQFWIYKPPPKKQDAARYHRLYLPGDGEAHRLGAAKYVPLWPDTARLLRRSAGEQHLGLDSQSAWEGWVRRYHIAWYLLLSSSILALAYLSISIVYDSIH